MNIETFWQAFLADNKLSKNTKYYEVFYFGDSQRLATELLTLVLSGQKTATTSCYRNFEITKQPLPQIGDYSIVTDYNQVPYCVIMTTATKILPFNKVDFKLAKLEGEDQCLQSWIDNHTRFFTREGLRCGYAFAPDMDVVFEVFKVVYIHKGVKHAK